MQSNFDIETQVKLARQFRSMHRKGNFFVIPNAWDVASARIFEEAGFTSVATSSAGMLVSLGYGDGEDIPFGEFIAAVRRISRVLTTPLSVDMVSGFGRTTEEVVKSVKDVIMTGAVGINIEDLSHAGRGIIETEEQVKRISAIREMSENIGVPFVINARTDEISHRGNKDLESSLEFAIKRAERYIDGGADCVYPMGLVDLDSIKRFVEAVKFPVNVMIREGIPRISTLRKIGVNRLSFGPYASYKAMGMLFKIGKEILEQDNFENLTEGAISYEMLNSLAVKKNIRSGNKF